MTIQPLLSNFERYLPLDLEETRLLEGRKDIATENQAQAVHFTRRRRVQALFIRGRRLLQNVRCG